MEEEILDFLYHKKQESISSSWYVQDIIQKQMVNKYFETVFHLIFWMGLHRLICKPVPATTAF